jgi:signal transduction histidine kinase/DNA-binding response OmpR family regulator
LSTAGRQTSTTAAPAATADSASARSSGRAVNLLLVDDQPNNLVALEALLADFGQNIIKARSGEEALRHILEKDFALILMDVQMPGLTGLDTAALIRERDKTRHTPIIFLTAHEPNDLQRFKGYALGAVDYLVKPLVPEILRSKVSVFIELYRKTEQIKLQAELLRDSQEREHIRRLGEERQRWEMERLREEAARERQLTEQLRQKAAELTSTIAERERAEEELSALKDELAAQLAEMTRLHQLSVRLSDTLELQPLYREILGAVVGLDNGDMGMLCLHDRDCGDLEIVSSTGLAEDYVEFLGRISKGQGACGAAPANGAAEVIEDIETEPAFASHLHRARAAGIRAAHSVPLLTRGGALIGAIAVYFRERRRPSDRQTRLVELYLRQAAHALENARLHREIQDASRRKDEFLAMLAHELRNPLAPILNAIHLLRRSDADQGAVEQASAMVERQVRVMARLVDDLLDVSRITRRKIQLRQEAVELTAVLGRAVQSTRIAMETANHSLEVRTPTEPVHIHVDPTRLEQILANLLNNAAKYTPPGGRVVLTAERADQEVILRVQDNGIGIAPEMLPRVFELFAQAERSLDRSQGGLGIGLTLVQRLVELHGGSVRAYSEGLGRGSEFVVRLPVVCQPAAEERPASRAPSSGASTSVLVVDDSKDTADSLAMLLGLCRHQVYVANNGARALELAREHRPQVVIMDIGLPGMDGYETARRLRREAGMESAFLIAMTGYGQQEDRLRSREAGFNEHLVKPVDLAVLQEFIGRAQSQR